MQKLRGASNFSSNYLFIFSRTLSLFELNVCLLFFFNQSVQKMIENKPNKCIVIESEAAASGVLYSDYFNVFTRFCITRRTSKSTNLLVTSFMNYKKTPNFIVKGNIKHPLIYPFSSQIINIPLVTSRCDRKEQFEYDEGLLHIHRYDI